MAALGPFACSWLLYVVGFTSRIMPRMRHDPKSEKKQKVPSKFLELGRFQVGVHQPGRTRWGGILWSHVWFPTKSQLWIVTSSRCWKPWRVPSGTMIPLTNCWQPQMRVAMGSYRWRIACENFPEYRGILGIPLGLSVQESSSVKVLPLTNLSPKRQLSPLG